MIAFRQGIDLFLNECSQNKDLQVDLLTRVSRGGYSRGDAQIISQRHSLVSGDYDRIANVYRAFVRMEIGGYEMSELEFEALRDSLNKIMPSTLNKYEPIYTALTNRLDKHNPNSPKPIDALKECSFEEFKELMRSVCSERGISEEFYNNSEMVADADRDAAVAELPVQPQTMVVNERNHLGIQTVTPKGKGTNPLHQLGMSLNVAKAARASNNMEELDAALDAAMKAYESIPSPGRGASRTK